MKKTFTHLLATAAIIAMPTLCMAQTENPRGVYKLTGLLDKYGNLIKEPYDQYKICTDSVTMMLSLQGDQFSIGRNDSEIFNYTGETPDANNATATRIFDSNAEHFTLKWWSTTPGHIYFPHNDWCTEYYESGKYSKNGKYILDALMSPNASHPKKPLIGTWRFIGMMDELHNVKKQLSVLRKDAAKGMNIGHLIFTPTRAIMYSNGNRGGSIALLAYDGKKKDQKIMMGSEQRFHEHAITWLSKDCIAMEIHVDGFRTDYQIWERVTDPTPLFDKIASQYLEH
ncbi:MAG: hypothetical protein IJ693_00125 [Bacteroidaceae bacterium]|nr:hypothetical protein [Bacteroidaceae bacterium]